MSQKRWSTARWKHRQAIQIRHRAKRAEAPKGSSRKKFAALYEAQRQATAPYVTVRLPIDYCLQTNPIGVFSLINVMRANYAAGKNVFQDYEAVQRVDTAALAILAATVNFHQGTCRTHANMPLNEVCKETILDSGMLTFTNYKDEVPRVPAGIMLQKSRSFRVEVRTAQRLIKHATERAFGERRRLPAAYRGLIEGMQNTFSHADKNEQGGQLWFAHVYADPISKKATFILLDNGVGIFRSINMRPFKTILRTIGIVDNQLVLKEILDRKILSSTGLKYRGRGLPSFRDAALRGTLKNMTIVANDVYANLSTNEYKKLRVQFDGTLLYWEVGE